jgi:hypothetical protein
LNLKIKSPASVAGGAFDFEIDKNKKNAVVITAFFVVLSYVSVYSIFIEYYKDSEGYKNCNKCNKKYF